MARSYRERIERAMSRGYSRAQARGHPSSSEPSIRQVREGLGRAATGGDPGELVYRWARETMTTDRQAGWELIQSLTGDAAERHQLYSIMMGSP